MSVIWRRVSVVPSCVSVVAMCVSVFLGVFLLLVRENCCSLLYFHLIETFPFLVMSAENTFSSFIKRWKLRLRNRTLKHMFRFKRHITKKPNINCANRSYPLRLSSFRRQKCQKLGEASVLVVLQTGSFEVSIFHFHLLAAQWQISKWTLRQKWPWHDWLGGYD